jgi:hypothetical protein
VVDERTVDEHLGAVLNGLLDAVYQAKQASWAASTSPMRAALQALVAFLIDHSGRFMVAEERIGGRADGIASPSSHQRGNILAEAHGDLGTAVSVLVQRLDALAADVRKRATAIADDAHVPLFTALAEGLQAHVARLRSD